MSRPRTGAPLAGSAYAAGQAAILLNEVGKMELNISWDNWKKTLRTAINAAEFAGLSEDRIKDAAYRLGGFLAGHFDPGNREQALLQELWREGTEEERQALVSMLVKMLDKEERIKH